MTATLSRESVMSQFKTLEIDALRSLVGKTFAMIDFLRDHADNGKLGRFALMSRIAANIAAIGSECDLPCGYNDPDDPFADETMLVLRFQFDEMRQGDYPRPLPAEGERK